MSYTRSRASKVKILGLVILVAGLLLMGLRALQTPIGGVKLLIDKPIPPGGVVRVRIEGPGEGLGEAVARAINDWNRAIEDYNNMKGLECSLGRMISGCSACVKVPPISITGGDDYNVLVTFVDEQPPEGRVADYEVKGQAVNIRIWKGAGYEKAYQAALYLIGRIQGVEVLDRRRTLFGAIPATSMPEVLQLHAPPINSRIRPTTLEAAGILASRLGHYGRGTVYFTAFKACDEPDFTIPALISPALITLGACLYRRGRHAG